MAASIGAGFAPLAWPPRKANAGSASTLPFPPYCRKKSRSDPSGRVAANARSIWIFTMMDFVAARRIMVDSQVRTSDVTDPRLIAAMLAVPRERFLPSEQADLAYLDFDVPVAAAERGKPPRRLLKPMVLAKLLQAAQIAAGDHVLEVGCASGYASAFLARLA